MIKSLYNILARAVWLVHWQQHCTALLCEREREREIVIIIVTKREGEQRVKVVEFFFPHLLSKREHHPVRASVCVLAHTSL